ncbi:hypothetical protein E3U44_17115 [Nitrosococcus wardiae]|uniref:Uncharacterized protein n=1 Tax=Nitrosococcus wardiae TaxID=1814290 RepID=A0A4P7C4Y9_9GAMM|nr:hypothetical protein E3U44_17115 [Nitrosococcus wardiae]
MELRSRAKRFLSQPEVAQAAMPSKQFQIIAGESLPPGWIGKHESIKHREKSSSLLAGRAVCLLLELCYGAYPQRGNPSERGIKDP